MASAQFMNRNYTETVRISQGSTPTGKVVLAAAYTLLENPEKAAEVVKKLLDTNPNFNLSQWKLGRLRYWKSEENRTRLYNAAKKAGIPEFPKDQYLIGDYPSEKRGVFIRDNVIRSWPFPVV